MALSELDRNLLQRCLARKPRAWEEFVDRFMGLMVHVVNHTAASRSIRLSPEDREDLVAHIFLQLVKDDMAVLHQFRGESSLAPYLTVIARRLVVHELLKRRSTAPLGTHEPSANAAGERLDQQEEIRRLLDELDQDEANVVRMFHLEGKNYHEISSVTGMPENSIGPLLSRARRKMRHLGADSPS